MGPINPIRPVSLTPLRTAQQAVARADERLATARHINRGSDDPAGLIASAMLGARGAELNARIDAAERESMFLRARDGALGAVGVMAGDLASLVVGAANAGGLGSGEADAIGSQIAGIAGAIDTVASGARFNGSATLEGFDAGSLGRTRIGTDPDTGEPVFASVRDLDRLAGENPEAAQMVARQAVEDVAVARAEAGMRERALECERRSAETEWINTARARSAIRDTDYARETGERARAALLEQAALRVAVMGRQGAARAADLLLGGLVDRSA
jgi:flagellin-like hook-associated protein FlgL